MSNFLLKFLFVLFLLSSLLCLTSCDSDSDFSISDDEECTSCGSASSRDKINKKKPKKQQQQKPKYTQEELERYAEYVKQQQAYEQQQSKKSKEEIQAEQQQHRDNLPKFDFKDTAYKSLDDLKNITLPEKTWGCGVTLIPSGLFLMGSEDDENYVEDGEAPLRKVRISNSFYMDKCEVTNGQFFNYWINNNQKGLTEAEKYKWTFVFALLVSKKVNDQIQSAVQSAPWWIPVPDADFRHPYGPDSNFNDILNHPVSHVGWTDATLYCKWLNGRLPSEAEWEFAARGNLKQKKFPWGNEMNPNLTIDGSYSINIFTGEPYSEDNGKDGWPATAPVGSYWPNNFGLYDMSGNLWEWVNDYWTNRPTQARKGKRLKDPKGPKYGRDRTMKGGSYMCHKETCRRYRVSGRSHAEPDSSTGNLGFRCVYDTKPNFKFPINKNDNKKEL